MKKLLMLVVLLTGCSSDAKPFCCGERPGYHVPCRANELPESRYEEYTNLPVKAYRDADRNLYYVWDTSEKFFYVKDRVVTTKDVVKGDK